MALNEARSWLIAYDIADPKRLRRVHGHLKKLAVPLQYSLFAASGTAQAIGRLRDGLAELINAREDDVRIYLVPKRLDISCYGRRLLPSDLTVLQAGAGGDIWRLAAGRPDAPLVPAETADRQLQALEELRQPHFHPSEKEEKN